MLRVGSVLKGYGIAASDGDIGTISDIRFDDASWRVRWLVIDTGNWLPGRKVLVQPSVCGAPNDEARSLPVRLTKAQVEASPDIRQDQPISQQMENDTYGYYGWDPMWGGSMFGAGPMGFYDAPAQYRATREEAELAELVNRPGRQDPHLRSLAEVTGYDIQATDGGIGHLEDVLLDDAHWLLRYLIVDTRNWWPGKHVLLSPYAVREFDWSNQEVRVGTTRAVVRASPEWDPLALIERAYEQRLHRHYGWPDLAD
jgi:sporulation protein YlmC with PRC-barrel domain